MDIKRKCFEESNNVNPDWSFKFDEELQQYIALDNEMGLQVDDFNDYWDTFRSGWQAAKAEAIPDGYKVVPVNYECVWCGCTELDGWTDETMLEAQEQSHDN